MHISFFNSKKIKKKLNVLLILHSVKKAKNTLFLFFSNKTKVYLRFAKSLFVELNVKFLQYIYNCKKQTYTSYNLRSCYL